MRDIGWLFCPFSEPKINDLNAKYAVTRCDLHLKYDHWHRVIELPKRKIRIEWKTARRDKKNDKSR
jgi:hypothetical protein